jgi:hypothetical protein
MGKGSRPRPFEVDTEKFTSNWEKTFGKKDIKEEKKEDRKDPETTESTKTK